MRKIYRDRIRVVEDQSNRNAERVTTQEAQTTNLWTRIRALEAETHELFNDLTADVVSLDTRVRVLSLPLSRPAKPKAKRA